jgi:NAD(P)H-hydrate repair Nnr-like enzyme with NAD(P)H-hydrate dehydratase domain
MGDALSGILGGLLAQGLTPPEAACLGVYLHGAVADDVAARQGQIGLLASDVIEGVPVALLRLRASIGGVTSHLPRRRVE